MKSWSEAIEALGDELAAMEDRLFELIDDAVLRGDCARAHAIIEARSHGAPLADVLERFETA